MHEQVSASIQQMVSDTMSAALLASLFYEHMLADKEARPYLLSNDLAHAPKMRQSEFGMWLEHKASIIFHESPEL